MTHTHTRARIVSTTAAVALLLSACGTTNGGATETSASQGAAKVTFSAEPTESETESASAATDPTQASEDSDYKYELADGSWYDTQGRYWNADGTRGTYEMDLAGSPDDFPDEENVEAITATAKGFWYGYYEWGWESELADKQWLANVKEWTTDGYYQQLDDRYGDVEDASFWRDIWYNRIDYTAWVRTVEIDTTWPFDADNFWVMSLVSHTENYDGNMRDLEDVTPTYEYTHITRVDGEWLVDDALSIVVDGETPGSILRESGQSGE